VSDVTVFGIKIAPGVWRRPQGSVTLIDVRSGMRFYGATKAEALKAAKLVKPNGLFQILPAGRI
jgi:hypothetical protein